MRIRSPPYARAYARPINATAGRTGFVILKLQLIIINRRRDDLYIYILHRLLGAPRTQIYNIMYLFIYYLFAPILKINRNHTTGGGGEVIASPQMSFFVFFSRPTENNFYANESLLYRQRITYRVVRTQTFQ